MEYPQRRSILRIQTVDPNPVGRGSSVCGNLDLVLIWNTVELPELSRGDVRDESFTDPKPRREHLRKRGLRCSSQVIDVRMHLVPLPSSEPSAYRGRSVTCSESLRPVDQAMLFLSYPLTSTIRIHDDHRASESCVLV